MCRCHHHHHHHHCWQPPVCEEPQVPQQPSCPGGSGGAMPGGWSAWRPVNAQDIAIFEQAMQGLMGARYTPLYVKTQVVAGTNYLFYAQQVLTTLPPVTNYVYVSVYVDLNGNVTRNSITQA